VKREIAWFLQSPQFFDMKKAQTCPTGSARQVCAVRADVTQKLIFFTQNHLICAFA
jgi:hypothetical protein